MIIATVTSNGETGRAKLIQAKPVQNILYCFIPFSYGAQWKLVYYFFKTFFTFSNAEMVSIMASRKTVRNKSIFAHRNNV